MTLFRNLIEKIWDKLLILTGVLCVLLPTSPWNMPLAYRDSGVFLYTGWRILNGELPYRDIWDHKSPVIFYIDALGLAMADTSRWGVWLVELAMLFAAAFLGYLLIKRIFGILPSLVSLVLWLLTLVFVLQGGNLTTEYTLPLQFAALYLVYHADRSKRPDRDYFLIGLTGAIAFFTKQTAAGTWIAILIALTVVRLSAKQSRRWIHELSLIALGGLAFSAIVIVFFGIQGALPQFWSAAFEYNFVYAARTASLPSERLEAVIRGIRPLTRAGLFQLAVTGYGIAIGLMLFRKSSLEKAVPLLLAGLIALPLELILIGLPGRTFAHYYMTLLPVLAIFAGLTVWAVTSFIPDGRIYQGSKYALALLLVGFIAWRSFDDYLNQVYLYRDLTKTEPVIEYVVENSAPGEQVLLWGSEASVNYFARRGSPTRFVYQGPLQQEGYVDEAMINEFLDDVIRNQPKFVIDTDTRDPLFSFPITTPAIEEKSNYLRSRYCIVRQIDSWKIHEYTEGVCQS